MNGSRFWRRRGRFFPIPAFPKTGSGSLEHSALALDAPRIGSHFLRRNRREVLKRWRLAGILSARFSAGRTPAARRGGKKRPRYLLYFLLMPPIHKDQAQQAEIFFHARQPAWIGEVAAAEIIAVARRQDWRRPCRAQRPSGPRQAGQ